MNLDLLIIGAGPAGISAALEAKKHGLTYLVIEKGLIGNTIYNYPVGLTVFSTTDELEFAAGDLEPVRDKPTREELLSYYVRTVLENDLNIQTEETVSEVKGRNHLCERVEDPDHSEGFHAKSQSRQEDIFQIITDKAEYKARNVLFAIGAMDHPRKLNVPGEDLPKVHNMFRETYPWVKKQAMIIGGGNSAGEAALFLAEEGSDVTLAIFRNDWENTDPKQGCIKYWVKQPLEEELRNNCLKLFFLGKVVEIREHEIELEDENGQTHILPNDVVFVLIGSDAELSLLRNLGVETEQCKYGEVPVYNEETFETNIKGIYVAGHFTNHRHIKGAIDGGRLPVRHIAGK